MSKTLECTMVFGNKSRLGNSVKRKSLTVFGKIDGFENSSNDDRIETGLF